MSRASILWDVLIPSRSNNPWVEFPNGRFLPIIRDITSLQQKGAESKIDVRFMQKQQKTKVIHYGLTLVFVMTVHSAPDLLML